MSAEDYARYRQMMASFVTEDDEPVDNLFSEKQQRLLAESLYASWSHPKFGKRFIAAANVGVFYAQDDPPLVPDLFLSLDVTPLPDVWSQEGRSYFVWVYGKPPDVVVEVVSNRKGEELERKAVLYWRIRVPFYVVYDPHRELGDTVLRVFINGPAGWRPADPNQLEGVELGLTLWHGTYEGLEADWLRWRDASGQLVLTGRELAEAERQRVEVERQRAEAVARELEAERQRAEQLKARLRALGIDPDNL